MGDLFSFAAGCVHGFTLSYGLNFSLFLAGLVGGTTHCVMMCGPFVLAQTGEIKKLKDAALIPYHLGRMTTYMGLTILTYSVFHLVFVFSDIKAMIAAPILLLAGIIFLVSAFPTLSALFPWAQNITFTLPFRWLQKAFNGVSQKNGILSHYLMGVLLGFMPCGLVVSALLAASTAPTLLSAVGAMGLFSVGTMPALIILAVGGKTLAYKYPEFFDMFAKSTKVLSAIWLFMLSGFLIF